MEAVTQRPAGGRAGRGRPEGRGCSFDPRTALLVKMPGTTQTGREGHAGTEHGELRCGPLSTNRKEKGAGGRKAGPQLQQAGPGRRPRRAGEQSARQGAPRRRSAQPGQGTRRPARPPPGPGPGPRPPRWRPARTDAVSESAESESLIKTTLGIPGCRYGVLFCCSLRSSAGILAFAGL